MLLIDTLQHYRAAGAYKLFDFVIMPDHIHLILTPSDATLERAMQLIKGGFSHRLASKMPVWQRGFTDHRIRDRHDFEERRRYLRGNPVKAGLCERPEQYRFSSASTPAAKAASP